MIDRLCYIFCLINLDQSLSSSCCRVLVHSVNAVHSVYLFDETSYTAAFVDCRIRSVLYLLVFQSSINPLACCSYILCRRNNQFNPVPLSDLDSNGEQVKLDTASMGQQAVVVKNGKRICGSGAALANCHISQNKAYFEVKIQSSGTWGVGLATPKVGISLLFHSCAFPYYLCHISCIIMEQVIITKPITTRKFPRWTRFHWLLPHKY